VCRAAERSHPNGVLVGLEISRAEQPAIEAALAATDDADARKRLLATKHFSTARHDGKDSEAMLALLLELRRQKRAGLAIDVVAFDVDPATVTPATERDLEMARELGAAIDAHPDATALAYVGNYHALRRKPPQIDQKPMVAYLVEDHPDLIALDFATAGGSYWACDAKCGVKHGTGTDRGTEPFVAIDDSQGDAYDGFLYVGSITASPPAKK
jgi:hypothetical protein